MGTLEKLAEEIKKLPLSMVINLRTNLTKKGARYFGICPFHEDHTVGSFEVNDDKNIAKCFSCDSFVVDPSFFISRVDKITRNAAILRIAVELGMITKEEAQDMSGHQFVDFKKIQAESVKKLLSSDNDKLIAKPEILDLVYKTISKNGNKLNGGNDVLTKEHRDYLHQRGIDDKTIERNGYFTMPTRKAVKEIVKKLSSFDFTNQDLNGIPGFYLWEAKGFYTLKEYKGIGIPIRDIKGKIVAIQCRRDGEIKPGEQRYLWWSSIKETNGSSPGSPIDINIPREIKKNSLFITEGHFKADLLSNKYGVPTISVQGVGNWKKIPETIKSFTNTQTIYIAYDADMAINEAVRLQAIKLGAAINKTYPKLAIYYVLWDFNYGKGIDDFLLNKKRPEGVKPKLISYQDFQKKIEILNKEIKNGRDSAEVFLETFL